jgi:hypothetical protein
MSVQYIYQFDYHFNYSENQIDVRKITPQEKKWCVDMARLYTEHCCSIGKYGTARRLLKDHFPEELV